MCRFTAYLGKEEICLSTVVKDSDNSLVHQSARPSKKNKKGANADGFGFGWCESNSQKPKLFKSSKPIHNHLNFIKLSQKTKSKCFLGHIRAATVGTVSTHNAHPFIYKNYIFAHNGTIYGYKDIKKELLKMVDTRFSSKFGTDSKFLFNLFSSNFSKNNFNFKSLINRFREITNHIVAVQHQLDKKLFCRLNLVATDGRFIFATRYVTDTNKKCLSLFYKKMEGSVIVSSEPLDQDDCLWVEVPINHALWVDESLDIKIIKI